MDIEFNELDETMKSNQGIPKILPILPLRDIVIYPNMIFPVLIGRASSLKAVSDAMEKNKYIFVAAQKNSAVEEPSYNDIYKYGTVAKIIQILRLPNNLLKVLVEGFAHGVYKKIKKQKEYMQGEVTVLENTFKKNDPELEALMRISADSFKQYIKSNNNMPSDIIAAFDNISEPVKKLYYAAANLQVKVEQKQRILEKIPLKEQFFELSSVLNSELELLKIETEIDTKVQDTIQKTQKKYYIQEQIRALQKELGEEDEFIPEIQQIKDALDKCEMPEAVKAKAWEEFNKLKKTPTMAPEFAVLRTYLELLTSLPWSEKTLDDLNIENVKKILNEDHYGLEKPKDRILEFIAVLNMAGFLKRQILCFVGPPGVGKTSLARSIARALGRNFVRFSLGGVRDEAEIRGHRRTYVGALPGKIIQSMKKAGSMNPVILLDEIDKMSTDFRGDPSAALLEVLDPEQNIMFNDHYLEVDYDLSNVMFITTANVRYDIPLPLQDRMEIIELSSYLDIDKLEIAKRHILPKLKEEFGIKDFNIDIDESALMRIIREYTRESGVRNLEREMSSLLRKVIKDIVANFGDKGLNGNGETSAVREALKDNPKFRKSMQKSKYIITSKEIEKYLKAPKFKDKKDELSDKTGVVTGLAWTSVGGDILPVEVAIMSGPERLTLTGKLGDVMKESARAALTFVRAYAEELGLEDGFYKKKEIHIHVPEGAIPKDGPSAGITMCMALISAFSGKDARGDIAMTGEITLRGNILPIGGLNEKLLAAKRHNIKTVLVPYDNKRDVDDINPVITKDLEIIFIKHAKEAMKHVFRDFKVTKKKPIKKTEEIAK